jgi:site-specific DNA-methyltransferase (adenine-specific)
MDGGAQSSATPIYNYFMDIAIRIRPNYISLIMPSRWMTAGKGLDKFRDSMIHDTRIRIMHDYFNAGECFTNVDIKGGVCYFLWDSSYKGTTKIYTHYSKEKIIESNRFLAESNENIFVRDANILTIKNKVWLKEQDSFETIVSSRKPYGLPSDFFKDQNKYNLPEISDKKIPNGYEIIGLGKKMNREVKYINKNYPLPKSEGINEVKIFIPESFGNGIMGEGISDPIIAMPGQLCTETFLQIRPLKNEIYAKNIITYMNTKLFRLLVGIIKTTQHGTKNVYSLVPMQDFSEEWTDSKLYTKYKLSKEDINYIESLFVGKNEKVR